jgi:hypothetical protein
MDRSTGLLLACISLSLTACDLGDALGVGGDAGSARYHPDYSAAAPAHRADLPCGDSDPERLCLAVKLVSFEDGGGMPVLARAQADRTIRDVNAIWSQCRIDFTLDSYASVDPRAYGLPYQPASQGDLNATRARFSTADALLVAGTGDWVGDLGAGKANAWSVLPPLGPFGAVFERAVAGFSGVVAHELGHTLNLEHRDDPFDVMDPVVYQSSINLTDDQCREARATAVSFWGRALR